MTLLPENLRHLVQSYHFALLIFASSLSVLTATGRIGNADAADQLYAATHWVLTGKLGVTNPPGGLDAEASAHFGCDVPKRFFWKSANGLYYQTHELGNVLCLVPAAAVGALVSRGSLEERLENPPDLSKAVASLTSSLQAVVCVLLLFSVLRRFMPEQAASRWSGVFLVCSFFLAYTRMPWDVAPAGIFALLAMRQTLRLIERPGSLTDLILLAVAGAGVASFRYSFAPFVGLGVAVSLWPVFRRIPMTHLLWAFIVFAVAVAPQLFYNHVRMGSFLTPATTIPRYPLAPQLSTETLTGFVELLFAPDIALFLYCPTLLMLAAVWRVPTKLRFFAAGLLVSTALYLLLIGSLPERVWATGLRGWGPRYLVPALPSLFALAVIVSTGCGKTGLWAVRVLTFTGVVVNLPMLFANWPIVQTSLGAPPQVWTADKNPVLNMWYVLSPGITTGQHQLSGIEAGPNVTLTFPDWMIVHIGSTSLAGNVAAWLVGLTLLALVSWSLWRICAKKRLPSQ